MKLLIMTRGRVGKQITLSAIPEDWRDRTYLVIPWEEKGLHDHQCLVAPDWVTNYSQKFQFCLDYAFLDQQKIVIMDDDLSFSERDTSVAGKVRFTKIWDQNVLSRAFSYMEELLDTTALVSMHPRQMAHQAPFPYKENGKVICIQAVNRDLADPIPKVDEYPILADVFLNCALLSRGLGNKLITTVVQDHASCQAPGGCSIYRTPEMQRQAVEAVAAAYPDFATVVFKKAKQANWMGDEGRYDLRVQWKKMYEAGVANRGG